MYKCLKTKITYSQNVLTSYRKIMCCEAHVKVSNFKF